MEYEIVSLFSDPVEYEAFKGYCINKITDVLETSLYPGIQKNIRFSICATPLTIERETGNAQGAITGWAFTNSKMPAENRFKKIARSTKTPIEDIVQCGQWTFSPSGLPVSILTGKLAADSARNTWKGKKK